MGKRGHKITPQRARAKPKAWKEPFLAELRATGNRTEAARRVGVARETAHRERKKDPAFATAWDEAVDEAVEALEYEARRRGFEGYDEPVVHQGKFTVVKDEKTGEKHVLTIRKYSDTLLIRLLEANRPEKYRRRIDQEVNMRGSVTLYLPKKGS